MRLLIVLSLVLSAMLPAGCIKHKEKEKHFKIGVIQYASTNAQTLLGFKDKLHSLGFIEGKNVTYLDLGYAETIEDIRPKLTKILAEKPDLIFSSTTPATIAAYEMTRSNNIPVVFAPVNDPVKAGIVSNLILPGGENITGVRLGPSDDKRLEWLTLLRSDISRVLIPYNPEDQSAVISLEAIINAAVVLDIELVTIPVSSQTAIDQLISNIPDDVQAIYIPRDSSVMSRNSDFVFISRQRGLILSAPIYELVQAGATTGYGFIGSLVGEQAARMAGIILNGVAPGNIPVETAEDYFFINFDAINEIGLKVPDSILRQAYRK